ncbi:cephalosporin hydroxylase family protein [Synechococcus sp. MIT S9220]|uniref:class I SAM-dependent methyltransferase n=1 Tax=unclassified Synechococcus TaxID=2626047 RepID=UPI00164C0DF2|nr:class I SAM-dependent methyltransferase [Synechococcus sp. MIT S9220]NOL48014.1 class I SAM-dependent methyltransferase [Synechococcus sp. MIT S9220]QNJ21548.1 cephalosporin hydroxylase family protein [Synechococcus sp. MIT S9220]
MKPILALRTRIYIVTRPLIAFIDSLISSVWHDFPLGRYPIGSEQLYLELANKASSISYPEIDSYERDVGYSIDLEWLNDLALQTQVVCKTSPVCYEHGRLLYSTIRAYLADNNFSPTEKLSIVETGTARGFSSICMAKALHDASHPGVIHTFDLLPHDVPIYWNCIADHQRGPLSRSSLLDRWNNLISNYIIFISGDTRNQLQKMHFSRVHLAFLDGAHTFDDIIFEFNQIKDHQKSGDYIIYDDYTPSYFPELVKAVDYICLTYSYSFLKISASTSRGYLIAIKN